jgi:RNA ligase
MFPSIAKLDDLLPFVQSNKQIRVKPCDTTGHTVVCYMVQDEDTFDGDHHEFARECRGISFDKNGKISARTMHKFFNVGERPETQPDVINWREVTRIMEKRDGSMVTPVLLTEKTFKFKTKKSFTTPEAGLADSICREDLNKYQWVLRLLQGGYTPTFEITSPRFPIVVRYEKDELTLLHVRENATGRYLSADDLKWLLPPFALVLDHSGEFKVDGVVSWDKLKVASETAEGMEGWVIQFRSGEMVKLKTKWYIDLHHSVTFTRWRDIARTVCADQSDDLKAAFAMVGRSVEPILQVERKIKSRIETVELLVRACVLHAKTNGMSIKETALHFKENEFFGLIMRSFRDQEINWVEFYEKHYLERDFGLEVVA